MKRKTKREVLWCFDIRRVVKFVHCFVFFNIYSIYSSMPLICWNIFFFFFLCRHFVTGTCLPSVRPLMTGWRAGTNRVANRRWSSSAVKAEPEKRRPPNWLCNIWPLWITAKYRAVQRLDHRRRSWRNRSSRRRLFSKVSATPQPSATTTRRVSANTRRFSLESEW